jgi:uncharacterized membrane protein
MSYKTFRLWRSVMTAVIAAAAAASIVLGNVVILLAAIVIGVVLLILLRRRVVEVISDERTYTIAYKAARLTLGAGGVAMALVGAILLALARQDFSSTLAQAGLTLEYATCGLLVINYIAYYYYSRKLGGGD